MIRTRIRRGVAVAAALAAGTVGVLASAPNVQAGPGGNGQGLAIGNEKGLYVVQMIDMPVVAYDGSIRGLAATQPKAGQKINPNSAKVKKYVDYLDATHASALAKVGGKKVYDYRYAFNGFAAEMTELDAVKMQGLPGVLAVSKNEMRQLVTADTPEFLGLSEAGGLWEQLGGPESGKKQDGAGEGVIVGIIDSGVWPESPSFSDRDEDGKLVYQQIPGWHGKCVPGEAFDASMCNQKLIGAQYFNEGFGGNDGVDASFANAYEFNSPRDADGHGTHTASTAAGNYGVDTGITLAGQTLGAVSGIAPRARVAVYKVCWGISPDGGCSSVDSVAAIDQAVADGVDVLNYSISGTSANFLDPVEVAFLFAADAGVYVAASAGNDGPGAETLNHPSPWLTTVAASTHNRVAIGSGSLGNGTELAGASVSATSVPADLVYADDAGDVLCNPGALDPAVVAGKIVACDRGAIARVDKSLAVAQAGGVGMILMNTAPNTLNGDNHFVPSLHVDEVARATILAYIAADPAPTATIDQAQVRFDGEPNMATFSSRGPILGGTSDVLKPDITAPGVDVLAAVSPYSSAGGVGYDFLSGTSMSSPHMAGIGALMKDAHPDWSAMMIKSALMTTAHQNVTDDSTGSLQPADAFDYGAGHVEPNSAVDPGLVYDAGWNDWLGFLCGTGDLAGSSFCPILEMDPSDLNQASIAVGALAGSQTVTRTVTNVGPAATYTAEVTGLDGVSADVVPGAVTLAPGESATFTVTFTTEPTATLNDYTQGALWWHGSEGHEVRSPVVVRPVALSAPAEVLSHGEDMSFEVGFGFSGDFSAASVGLVAADTAVGTVDDDPANDFATALGAGVGLTLHEVFVPAGTELARFSLFDDYTDGADDLDLYAFYDRDGNGSYTIDEFLAGSGSPTSAEQIDLELGLPFDIVVGVYVHGWQTAGGAPTGYTLFSWNLAPVDAGNMTVTVPSPVVQGGTGDVDVAFSGLDVDMKYLGAVDFTLAGNDAGRTYVRVDTD